MGLADQLTLARIAAVPVVLLLVELDFEGHDYWATAVFAVAMATDWLDGRIARRRGHSSRLGSLLDPIADKVLVLAMLIALTGRGVFAGWMVAAIVARELLVSGLRLAALERGVVLAARDLGKVKTWAQALAAVVGGLAAAGAVDDAVAEWTLVVALVADVGLRARLRPPRAERARRSRLATDLTATAYAAASGRRRGSLRLRELGLGHSPMSRLMASTSRAIQSPWSSSSSCAARQA